jgi:hypothetical protein
MNADELSGFAGRLTEFIKASGACAVGFCNAESLKGGGAVYRPGARNGQRQVGYRIRLPRRGPS